MYIYIYTMDERIFDIDEQIEDLQRYRRTAEILCLHYRNNNSIVEGFGLPFKVLWENSISIKFLIESMRLDNDIRFLTESRFCVYKHINNVIKMLNDKKQEYNIRIIYRKNWENNLQNNNNNI